MKIKLEHRGREIWLESDAHNFIVHDGYKEYEDKDGKTIETRINVRSYSQLSFALNDMSNTEMRRSDATLMQQMYDELRELNRLILNRTDVA